MNLYNEKAHCAKCGQWDAGTYYAKGDRTITRTCRRCWHQWCEAPLDSAPDPILAAAIAEVDRIAPTPEASPNE